MGGNFDSPSRFIDLFEHAGWENGVNIFTAINSVISMLQSTGKLGRENIITRVSDRLQVDDHGIIYRFYPGNEYQLVTRHLVEENTTAVRIYKGDIEEYSEEVFKWE